VGVGAATALAACGKQSSQQSADTVTVPAGPVFATEAPRPVITNPDVALQQLRDGNKRFVDAQMRNPNRDPASRLSLSKSQQPFAVVLSCSDSRLPPEVIFDQGLGDLFVARVAGNIVDAALLDSIEYGVAHLGAPLVVVMGHQNCGAVSATLKTVQDHKAPEEDMNALVTAIKPAITVAEQRQGDLLDNTVRANAELSKDAIVATSVLKDKMNSGAVKVVTAYYSLDTGVATIA
jgi:carbonic anhydrase